MTEVTRDYVFHRDGRRIKYLRRAWHSACKRAAIAKRADAVEEVVRPALLGRVQRGPPGASPGDNWGDSEAKR